MTKTLTVRVDKKGRLIIPKEAREELDVQPGDLFFLEIDGTVLRYAKAVNPFDALAEHALKEHAAGRTASLRDVAAEYGVTLDAASE